MSNAANVAGASMALYVYGLIDRLEDQALLEKFTTFYQIRCLQVGGRGALVQDVTLEEFEEDVLKERVRDPHWLEAHVWQHAHVLEGAMRFGTVVPMKLLTVFRTEERLRQSLSELDETLGELCLRLQGKEEWGCKAFCDLQRIRAAVEAQNDEINELNAQIAAKPSGISYLKKKQLEEQLRRESSLRLAVHLDTISSRVSSAVHEAKFCPVARESNDRPMILNVSLLVEKTAFESLAAEVDALRQDYLSAGFEFELFGPLPPYSFSELPVCAGQSQASGSDGAIHA
jgi:hypothetical protein